jgi:hypothetical protein
VTCPVIVPAALAGCPSATVAEAPTANSERERISLLDIDAPFLRV